MNRQHEIEPYWQDENDWLWTIQLLPGDDPEGSLLGADIVGYLFGHAQLTNTRVIALPGNPGAALTSCYSPFGLQSKKRVHEAWFVRMRTGERLCR